MADTRPAVQDADPRVPRRIHSAVLPGLGRTLRLRRPESGSTPRSSPTRRGGAAYLDLVAQAADAAGCRGEAAGRGGRWGHRAPHGDGMAGRRHPATAADVRLLLDGPAPHRLPVWSMGLYLHVGLDGVGWDVSGDLWERRVVHFEYPYVGLPALDARRTWQATTGWE